MRTIQELAGLVLLMRNAQKEYFNTKSPAWLRQSKGLEAKVDGAVAAIINDAEGLFSENSSECINE